MILKEDPIFFLFSKVNTIVVYVASDSFFRPKPSQTNQINLTLQKQTKSLKQNKANSNLEIITSLMSYKRNIYISSYAILTEPINLADQL